MRIFRRLAVLAFSLLFVPAAFAQGFDHSALDRFLKQYVDEKGTVDYAAAKANRADLDLYLEQIKGVNLTQLQMSPKPEQKAFWLNVYHAGLLTLVLENYPLKSTQEIPNFWERQFLKIGLTDQEDPTRYSLSQIRSHILVAQFQDEKVHMALAFASKDGPPFPREIFTGPMVLGQLFKCARREVNAPGVVEWDAGAGVLRLSRVFEWYSPDFLTNFARPERRGKLNRTDTAVANFLIRYSKDIERIRFLKTAKYKLEYFPFDWTLNDRAAS